MAGNPEEELDVFTEEQREILKQRINVGVRGKDDERVFVPRGRMVKQNIDKIFGLDVACVRDKGGDVIYPQDWVIDCLPHPALYYVVEATKPEPRIDPEEDLYYSGTSILLIEKVPMEINAESLECWIRFGLKECDPPLQRCIKETKKLEMGIVAVERKLQQVPYLTIPTEPSEAGKSKERQRIGRLLNEERTEYEMKLEQEKATLKRLNKRPRTKLKMITVDKNIHEKTQTWHLVFPNNPRAYELSTALAKKEDWYEISLVMDGGPGHPPWAGRGEIPPETKASNYVNTRLIEVSREMHGPEKCTYYYPNGDLYYGSYKYGKMHGYGELYMRSGRYEGEFEENRLRGDAYWVMSDGTKYEGNISQQRQFEPSLINGNEYANGTFHGKGKLTFPDGGIYEGHFENGKPHGRGKYTTNAECTEEGHFVDGILHGTDCKKTYAEGQEYEGPFTHGRVDGRGKAVYVGGHHYDGYFTQGRMEGFGTLIKKNGDRYDGYWSNNVRHGYGMQAVGNVKTVSVKGVSYLRYDQKYSGDYKCNKIRSRNCILLPIRLNENSDDVSTNVLCYSTSQRSPEYPRLMELPGIENRATRKFRKRQVRRQTGHKEVVDKVEGPNFRNFMRARFRARVLIEESAEFVDRVKTQIASDKAKDKARREREAIARAMQQRQLGGDGKIEVIEDDEEEDEIIKELEELLKKLEMIAIMRAPPNKYYLEERLEEIAYQEERFLEASKEKLRQKRKRKRKGNVGDDADAVQFGQ